MLKEPVVQDMHQKLLSNVRSAYLNDWGISDLQASSIFCTF